MRPFIPFSVIVLFGFTACSGSSGGGGRAGSGANSQIGHFLDSVVAGIAYTSGTSSGVTDATGKFEYAQGSDVQFSIGGIRLPKVAAAALLPPVQLAQGPADPKGALVTNIA